MSDLSPDDIALLEAQVPVGLLMPTDETMRLVHITRDVVEAHVGAAAESVTTTDGLVFWFDVGSGNLAVNRMATLNLLAVSSFSARTVPLLRGTALVTGQRAGNPAGLSDEQIEVLGRDPGPVWWVTSILRMRVGRDRQHRHA